MWGKKKNLQKKIFLNNKKQKEVDSISNKVNSNSNQQIVEIEPRISTPMNSKEIEEARRQLIEDKAEEMKQDILRLHKEGKSTREIGLLMGISREMARNIINGKGSLKIIATQRIERF